MGAAVETRPARPQHLIDQFCKSLINHHVLASPQSHRATVSPHGVAGSRAARWRVRLASWGGLPIPRRQGRLRTTESEGPKIYGGGFVWRAGVGYQYQGGKGGSEQQKVKDRRSTVEGSSGELGWVTNTKEARAAPNNRK